MVFVFLFLTYFTLYDRLLEGFNMQRTMIRFLLQKNYSKPHNSIFTAPGT